MASKRIKVKIKELGKVVGGATPSTKNPENWEGSIPWLTPKDLANHRERFIKKGEKSISQKGYESCSTKMLPKGTVLFSSRAPIGYCAIAENDICTNQGFKSIVPNENTDSLFLYYLLKSNVEAIASNASGTTFLEISGKAMEEIEVSIPEDKNEQIQIAKILDAFDRKIENNLKLNDYLAEVVRTEFDYRFGPGTPTTNLSDVMDISTQSLKPSAYAGEIWEHYSIPAFDENHRPVFEPADGIKSNKYVIDNDCILISKLNPSTKRLWLPRCTSERPVCSTEFIVYRPKKPEHKSFYYAAVDSPVFTDFLLAHVTGSTGSRQRTQPKATLNYPMSNPSNDDIEDFCEFADPIISKCQLNELESSRLEHLRDILLLKLMSGEIDVSQIELPTQPNNHLAVY